MCVENLRENRLYAIVVCLLFTCGDEKVVGAVELG